MFARMLCLASVLVALPAAFAQPRPAPNGPVMPAQDGGVREVLESIVIPPIPDVPFTASLITEWIRYTPGGASITFINKRQVARDARGRLYEERWALVPKDSDVKSRIQWVQIADAQAHTLYNCNMYTHVCDLLLYNSAPDLAAATAPLPQPGPLPGGKGTVQVDNLGTRMIAGIETTGTRVTTTLSPGTMGNDKPVVETKETWRAAQLGVNLLSIRSGPLIGTQTFTVSDLNPAPPDPQLFELPAGFTVRDQRTTRPPSD